MQQHVALGIADVHERAVGDQVADRRIVALADRQVAEVLHHRRALREDVRRVRPSPARARGARRAGRFFRLRRLLRALRLLGLCRLFRAGGRVGRLRGGLGLLAPGEDRLCRFGQLALVGAAAGVGREHAHLRAQAVELLRLVAGEPLERDRSLDLVRLGLQGLGRGRAGEAHLQRLADPGIVRRLFRARRGGGFLHGLCGLRGLRSLGRLRGRFGGVCGRRFRGCCGRRFGVRLGKGELVGVAQLVAALDAHGDGLAEQLLQGPRAQAAARDGPQRARADDAAADALVGRAPAGDEGVSLADGRLRLLRRGLRLCRLHGRCGRCERRGRCGRFWRLRGGGFRRGLLGGALLALVLAVLVLLVQEQVVGVDGAGVQPAVVRLAQDARVVVRPGKEQNRLRNVEPVAPGEDQGEVRGGEVVRRKVDRHQELDLPLVADALAAHVLHARGPVLGDDVLVVALGHHAGNLDGVVEHLRQGPGRNGLAGLADGVLLGEAVAADAVVDDVFELALGKVDGDGGVVDDLGDRAVERGHARAGVDVALGEAVVLDQLNLAVDKARVVAGEDAVLAQGVHLAGEVQVLGVLGQQPRVEIAVLLVLREDDFSIVVAVFVVVFQHQLGKGVPKVGLEDLVPRAAADERGIFLAAGKAPLLAGKENLVDAADEIVRLAEVLEVEVADVVGRKDAVHRGPRAHVDRGPLLPRMLADIGQDLLALGVRQADADRLGDDLARGLRRRLGNGDAALLVAGVVLDAAPIQLLLHKMVDVLLVLGGYITTQKIAELAVKNALVDVTEPEQSGFCHTFTPL